MRRLGCCGDAGARDGRAPRLLSASLSTVSTVALIYLPSVAGRHHACYGPRTDDCTNSTIVRVFAHMADSAVQRRSLQEALDSLCVRVSVSARLSLRWPCLQPRPARFGGAPAGSGS